MSHRVRAAVLTMVLATASAPALAQSSPAPPGVRDAPVSFGAEVSASLAPKDTTAFFNYTDYDHDTMRMSLIRLFGEWRLTPALSVLGEVRTEDFDRAEISALYVRWRPSPRHAFDVQAGRIPPVLGTFSRRAYGRDNPLIGVPLGYQYLTSIRPDALPATVDELLRMRGRGWQPSYSIGSTATDTGRPLDDASRWDTGVEARWRTGWWDLAGAWTRGSPAEPVVTDTNHGHEWSGRAGVRLPSGLSAGFSAARAQWPAESVLTLLPPAAAATSSQSLVGSDIEFSRGPWLARAEWLHSTFDMPTLAGTNAAHLGATSTFAETRWRFLPRWHAALRVDRLGFSPVSGTLFGGLPTAWDAPVHRIDAVVAFRVFRNTEVRAGWQENWRDAGRVTRLGVPAVQVLWWY